jgi:hypothetical protein
MKKILLGIFLFVGMIFSFGQVERAVGNFSSLKVYDRINVELIESSKNIIEISGDEDGRIEIINKNGELKIRTKTTQFLNGKNVKVKVYYDKLNEIQASQGAVIVSNEVLKANALSLTSNEGSFITLKLKVNQLDVRGNSGGEMNLSGSAKSQDIVMNSGAVFNGKEIKGEDIAVAVNAGGEADVYATESISAKVRAGGNIHIYGNPKNRKVNKILGNIHFH